MWNLRRWVLRPGVHVTVQLPPKRNKHIMRVVKRKYPRAVAPANRTDLVSRNFYCCLFEFLQISFGTDLSRRNPGVVRSSRIYAGRMMPFG
jgi:hypothetical protein